MKTWTKAAYIVLGGLLLNSLAFFNKFPLTYPDTAAYILSGFEKIVPNDRTIFYGYFIRHVSLWENLWLVVITQSTILSYLLYLWSTKKFGLSPRQYLSLMVILVFTTGIVLPAGQLIPDIFTPILILSVTLLVTTPLARAHRIVVGLILVISIPMHMSHVPLMLALLLALCILKKYFNASGSDWLRIFVLAIVGIIIIPLTHYLTDGELSFVKRGYLFRFNRLVEMGLVDDHLNNHCNPPEFKLCQYKDQVPTDFLWHPESPLEKMGGWDKNEKEYRQIIRGILTTPGYWPSIILQSAIEGFKQLFNFEVYDAQTINGDLVNGVVTRYFPHQEREVRSSYQEIHFDRLDHKLSFLTAVSYPIILISLLWLIIMLGKTTDNRWYSTFLIILISIVLNAFISGAFSTITPRYQNKVAWIAWAVLLLYSWPLVINCLRRLGLLSSIQKSEIDHHPS